MTESLSSFHNSSYVGIVYKSGIFVFQAILNIFLALLQHLHMQIVNCGP